MNKKPKPKTRPPGKKDRTPKQGPPPPPQPFAFTIEVLLGFLPVEIKEGKIVQTATKEMIEDRRKELERILRDVPEKVSREAIRAAQTRAVLWEWQDVLSRHSIPASWEWYRRTEPLIRQLLRRPELLEIIEGNLRHELGLPPWYGEDISGPRPAHLPGILENFLKAIHPVHPERRPGKPAKPWVQAAMKDLGKIGVIRRTIRELLLQAVGLEF